MIKCGWAGRSLLSLSVICFAWTASIAEEQLTSVKLETGSLSALFHDNTQSPGLLSGVQSLFHTAAPTFDAYDPDQRGASAGLNFEHIISGQSDPDNKFTPRKGIYTLHQIDERTVELRRQADDSPWRMESTMRYQLVPPHYIDFEFRCVPHQIEKYGDHEYAILFWANYMHEVEEVALNFLGIAGPDEPETWQRGEAPKTHPDYLGGGTYRHRDAEPLAYNEDHNFKLNVWSYDYPRYTKPFYFGRAQHNMAFMLMFDRSYSEEDEIRFSLFKFKVTEQNKRPAWDYQYVIHKVEAGKQYGYQGRLVWKPFVSNDDCLQEYEIWQQSLSKTTTSSRSR
ncbi:MAG: hypothetical protein KDA65_07880 [Planctomycetaceae bacterium]|nr:hypothetical protein [Planctomycetaceae bacterium]